MVCVEHAIVARGLIEDQLGYCDGIRGVRLAYDSDGNYSVVVLRERGAQVDVPDHFDNVAVHVQEVD